MKLISLVLFLMSASVFAATSSPRAVIQCKLGYYGKVSFHINLDSKKVTVEDDPKANSIAGYWQVKASYQKQGKISKRTEFKIDNFSPMHTIVLAGDNADDTDFLLTLTYLGPEPSIVGNLRDFGTDFEESSNIPAEKCKMKLE